MNKQNTIPFGQNLMNKQLYIQNINGMKTVNEYDMIDSCKKRNT